MKLTKSKLKEIIIDEMSQSVSGNTKFIKKNFLPMLRQLGVKHVQAKDDPYDSKTKLSFDTGKETEEKLKQLILKKLGKKGSAKRKKMNFTVSMKELKEMIREEINFIIEESAYKTATKNELAMYLTQLSNTINGTKDKKMLQFLKRTKKEVSDELKSRRKLTESSDGKWVVWTAEDAYDKNQKIMKVAKSRRAALIFYNKLVKTDKYEAIGMESAEHWNRTNSPKVKEGKLKEMMSEALLDAKSVKNMIWDMREDIDKLVDIGEDYAIFQSAKAASKALKQIQKLLKNVR
tara:strand:+ start:171 stop:1043 length:873 start_codon:yes stop_codon:yes gene_type:complete